MNNDELQEFQAQDELEKFQAYKDWCKKHGMNPMLRIKDDCYNGYASVFMFEHDFEPGQTLVAEFKNGRTLYSFHPCGAKEAATIGKHFFIISEVGINSFTGWWIGR